MLTALHHTLMCFPKSLFVRQMTVLQWCVILQIPFSVDAVLRCTWIFNLVFQESHWSNWAQLSTATIPTYSNTSVWLVEQPHTITLNAQSSRLSFTMLSAPVHLGFMKEVPPLRRYQTDSSLASRAPYSSCVFDQEVQRYVCVHEVCLRGKHASWQRVERPMRHTASRGHNATVASFCSIPM